MDASTRRLITAIMFLLLAMVAGVVGYRGSPLASGAEPHARAQTGLKGTLPSNVYVNAREQETPCSPGACR